MKKNDICKIGTNAKVSIKWSVSPIDYSEESEKKIIARMAEKYGIEKENIRVVPVFVKKNVDGSSTEYSNETISRIQDPKFQQSLYKEFLREKGIDRYDFDKIKEIDEFINNQINYEVYERNKKYVIKWMKWDNFMSYGEGNYVDFRDFKGIIHLASNPSNQGGKTTFCLDLLRFLLFGKVTSRENDWTMAKAFNKYIPAATTVNVEGCICIDGTDYVVKRTLTRPEQKKRTEKSKVTHKVTYYKVINDNYFELEDEDTIEKQDGASTTETNKIIKESIGNERDFDLMICVSADNLKELISLKDTERGRLISRWIGLLPLEEKDKLARETYNKTIAPKLMSNIYSATTLEETNTELDRMIAEAKDTNKSLLKESEDKVKILSTKRDLLITLTKELHPVDVRLTAIDVVTVENALNTIVKQAGDIKAEREAILKEIADLGEIEFIDEDTINRVSTNERETSNTIISLRSEAMNIKEMIEALKNGEYCPTCGAKLVNVDNTEKIAQYTAKLNDVIEKGKNLKPLLTKYQEELRGLQEKRSLYLAKSKKELQVAKYDAEIERLRSQWKEKNDLKRDIENNKEYISQNNIISLKIEGEKVEISNIEKQISQIASELVRNETTIKNWEIEKKKNIDIIEVLSKEEELVYNWKLYLDMVGKNGISKILIRTVLPIINGNLRHLLNDVCDFDVEVTIDDRNDVAFNIIHDGVRSSLASGSGFEQTVASLALRSVLSKISTFSKPSFVVFDEILGGVADENYDNVKRLYDKIVSDYSFIFQITHLKQIADWANKSLTVTKNKNISSITADEKK